MISDKAVVADIERASIHDGPGIRTVVFFKGCPLNCAWCHNPECIDPNPQEMFYPEKCIGCGRCKYGCFSGAKVICGREMTAEDIFKEISADKAYYSQDGGVTFSGGEPLMQRDIVKELVKRCKKENINTAAETSLFLFDAELLGSLDFIMADFKIFDSNKHRKYTGVPNEVIKENFLRLDKLNVPFIVRTPVIPGVNDTADEISKIRNYIKKLKNIKGYELLPYHPLGVSKQKALGLPETRFNVPANEEMEKLKGYADLRG